MMKYCCFCQYRLTHKEFETYYEQMKAIWSLYKLHGEIQCYTIIFQKMEFGVVFVVGKFYGFKSQEKQKGE